MTSHFLKIPTLFALLSQATTPAAAEDIAAFVAIFFDSFPSLKGRSFHLAAESYGVGKLRHE